MFNLGKNTPNNKSKPRELFDLEKSLVEDPAYARQLKEEIETRVQQLKTTMRQGGDQHSFDQAQGLLNGYLAAQKVLGRINRKPL